jgi:hypothetical protein
MAATKRRSTHRRRSEEWGSYLFEIEKVHAHYSFGDGSDLDRTAFSEHLQPQFDAHCLLPEKFKGRMTRFTFIGDRSLDRDQREQVQADQHSSGIGTLTFRGQKSEYLGALPFDPLWNVVLAAIAGGTRFIYLHGAALKHGSARISSTGFYEEFDPEDA